MERPPHARHLREGPIFLEGFLDVLRPQASYAGPERELRGGHHLGLGAAHVPRDAREGRDRQWSVEVVAGDSEGGDLLGRDPRGMAVRRVRFHSRRNG